MTHAALGVPRYLPCRIGPLRVAFDVTHLRSIRRGDGMQHNPSGLDPVGWLLDYDETPVVDVGHRLGIAPPLERRQGNDPGRVLIFDGDPRPCGLLVDASGRARDVQPGTLHPLPQLLQYLEPLGCLGLWTADGHVWLVLDAAVLHSPPVPRHAGGSGERRSANGGEATARPPRPSELIPALDAGQTSTGSPRAVPAIDDASREADTADSRGRLLLFSTHHGEAFEPPVRFALSMKQVLEVAALPTLESLPQAPHFVPGLALWRGRPLVVVDVDRRMGWTALQQTGQRLVVVQDVNGARLGLVASGELRMVRLPIPHRVSGLTLDHSLALGIFEVDDGMLIVPDLARFGGLSHSAPAVDR